ncbi:MAG TPA: hypothetical protein DCR55_09100 [Lentisphaeria bacterium]|nr:hypothetical protein [Lentisphaeria bacterium]
MHTGVGEDMRPDSENAQRLLMRRNAVCRLRLFVDASGLQRGLRRFSARFGQRSCITHRLYCNFSGESQLKFMVFWLASCICRATKSPVLRWH